MPKLSVIVPSRNDSGDPHHMRFMRQTVGDLLTKAAGDVEVIVVLDGYYPNPPLPEDRRLVVLHRGVPRGLRAAANAGAAVAKGEWLMKTDDHCKWAEGYDKALMEHCDGDWVAIPRRYSLDGEKWEYMPKSPVDYHYFDCPLTNKEFFQTNGVAWNERRQERSAPQYDIDDTPSFQGSVWFCLKEHFQKRMGGMDEGLLYGTFAQEPQEIGFKTWLSGGRVVVNKLTSYAHLHKGNAWGRGFRVNMAEVRRGHQFSGEYWMFNQWPRQVRKMEWLVEKFWPMPTWVENWRELLAQYQPVYIKV